ncbi:MAG: hypothetical protein K2Y37_00360 [Pirellulales bacterium]|nr:hypothetical protein [Pirellulales bacterium]
MTFTVRELPKAMADKHHIVRWLHDRSPQGAVAWLGAYDQMIERLKAAADTLPIAEEGERLNIEARQILFKTKRGRVYRAVFHLDAGDVFILRVRGPGQATIAADEWGQ